MIGLLAAAYGSVSDIELLWTLIALVGAGFSLYNVRDALKDYNSLGADPNGKRELASVAVKTEAGRLVVQCIFVAIGIAAMFVPEVPAAVEQPLSIEIVGFLVRWGIIASSVILTWKSYLVWRLRRTLARYDSDVG